VERQSLRWVLLRWVLLTGRRLLRVRLTGRRLLRVRLTRRLLGRILLTGRRLLRIGLGRISGWRLLRGTRWVRRPWHDGRRLLLTKRQP
jgi:hypothetical protein